MTKDSFTLFNRKCCGWLNEMYGVDEQGNRKQSVVLIADGAGAHQGSICEDCGIGLVRLPPASPELNPVERLFGELRKELANHVFNTLEQLEEFLVCILKKYYDNPQTIIQLTQYPYISLPN